MCPGWGTDANSCTLRMLLKYYLKFQLGPSLSFGPTTRPLELSAQRKTTCKSVIMLDLLSLTEICFLHWIIAACYEIRRCGSHFVCEAFLASFFFSRNSDLCFSNENVTKIKSFSSVCFWFPNFCAHLNSEITLVLRPKYHQYLLNKQFKPSIYFYYLGNLRSTGLSSPSILGSWTSVWVSEGYCITCVDTTFSIRNTLEYSKSFYTQV
jgi:hypothetical protein